MFDFIATAVSWHRINTFIDWDAVVVQLPYLKGDTLLYALEMLGSSKDKKYIPLLEGYLDSPNIWLQMTSLDALAQMWWDLSEKSDEIKQKKGIEAIKHIWFLLGNPHKHHTPETQIQKQFLQVQYEFIKNMRNWLGTTSENT